MKIYKTYFDKKDTPFVQEFQPKRKYHSVWKRFPYKTFLGHKVIKVLLFGFFPVLNSDKLKSPTSEIISTLRKIVELEMPKEVNEK